MLPNITDYVRFSWQIISGFRFSHEKGISELRNHDIWPYFQCRELKRILDLANGQLQPQITILKSQDYQVFGIDLVNYPKRKSMEIGYRIARWIFQKQNGISHLRPSDLNLICGDVVQLPYADNSFDLITSVAAFEHFLELPSIIDEVYRVLSYGGIIWTHIHLFTSLSGGHNVKIMEIPLKTLPRGIDPWDHLRRRRIPFHVPLNELRIHQYIEEFSRKFKILNHYCTTREGEHLLKPEIEVELSAYSREELTCGAFVIVAQKN